MRLSFEPPWLIADLGAPHRTLGWALNRPGFARASRVVWREVRDAELTPELDVARWLAAELDRRGLSEACAMVTSRDLARHVLRSAEVAGARADCVATVGLSNGERVGARTKVSSAGWGTINVALRISTPLGDGAMVEALSIAAEARTAAVMEAALAAGPDRPGGPITGTGTDCLVIAAPPGAGAYAGLHTPVGEAIGRAVYAAVRAGADEWWATVGRGARGGSRGGPRTG